jgi:hypothetical protein
MFDLIAKTGAGRGAAKRFAPLSVAAGLALVLTSVPVMAQKTPTNNLPPFPADPFQEAFDVCADASNNIDAAADNMEAAGWTIDDFYETGPYIVSMSASRQVNGADIYFFATFETYATVGLVYCTYDIEGAANAIDFQTVGPDFGLEGNVETNEGGIYGAWERLTDDDAVVITARHEGDYFFVQMNWFAPLEGTGGTGGGK